MKITITTSSLDIFTYDVDETTTIYSLKERLHREKSKYPIDCMKLVGDDILFHNDACIYDYGVNPYSKIRLVILPIILPVILPVEDTIDPQLNNWYHN